MPDILKEAQAKLEIPKGQLHVVSLAKPTLAGDAQPLRWDGEAEDGEVEFDPLGAPTHVKLQKSRRVPVNLSEPEGARQAIASIKKTFGAHAKLIELSFSGSRASINARDPKHPAKIRDWLYEDDHFADFKGTDQASFYRELQDDSFFDLDEIAAALPPRLAELLLTRASGHCPAKIGNDPSF